MKKLLICIDLALTLSACGSDHILRFNLAKQQGMVTTPAYKGRSHFFLWGMWQKTDYDLINACYPKGISVIETNWTFYGSQNWCAF